jgi:excisionase family DNA binding protein
VSEENRHQNLLVEGLVTVKEAGQFLGLSVASVYNLMGRGELPYVKLGRSRRIPRRALVELAARYLVGRGDS